MAKIKPFKALRYTQNAGDISDIICPPYDVIDEEQHKKLMEKNEYNMVNFELPISDKPYEMAKNLLDSWQKEGVLRFDDKDNFYIYEEEFEVLGEIKKLKGFIGLLELTDFSQGVVVPHENTLSKPKEDRFNLMKATDCNFSQIYCLYSDAEQYVKFILDSKTKSPADIEVSTGDGIIHRLWLLSDVSECNKICEYLKAKKLYIADGHHRYETALNYKKYCDENGLNQEIKGYDYVMTMFVDIENDGLVVFPTHRLIHNVNNFDEEEILKKCEEFFDVTYLSSLLNLEQELKSMYKKEEKVFGYYSKVKGFLLLRLKDKEVMKRFMPGFSRASMELDVNILHTLILENILCIDKINLINQTNLTYVKLFDEAIESVDNGESQAAFLINPTRVSEIKEVSDNDEKMPQKSTFFYPKLITGLVMNKLNK